MFSTLERGSGALSLSLSAKRIIVVWGWDDETPSYRGVERPWPLARQVEQRKERRGGLFLRGKLMIRIPPGADFQPAAHPAELFRGVHARLIAAHDAAR